MAEFITQREVLAQKIESLRGQMTGYGTEDVILINQIRRYQHKLNELDGIENSCDIQDDGCISCGS